MAAAAGAMLYVVVVEELIAETVRSGTVATLGSPEGSPS
jgi:hypothetical protein